jgi:DNA-binding NtrC family response regulator
MNTSGRILIADDDITALTTATDLIQGAGYHCAPVQNGVEAVRALETLKFDLLIAKILIPGNGQLDLAQAAHDQAPDMPVILYTQFPSPQTKTTMAVIRWGVSANLVKQVDYDVLLDQVNQCISRYDDHARVTTSVDRTILYIQAIDETIQILKSTKSSFKSPKLATLRRNLEHLLENNRSFPKPDL